MKEDNKLDLAASIRQKAEILADKNSLNQEKDLSEAETSRLIHELEVHQIELELQNEEIIKARDEAERIAERYTELYDFAPSGYFTLSKDGNIIEINLNASKMLNKDRSKLIHNRFNIFVSAVTKPIFNNFLKKVFKSHYRETCVITLEDDGNLPVNVQLAGISAENTDECIITAIDISERLRAEELIISKNKELIKLNAERNMFFSIIAHDLRGPMGGFMNFTEMMMNETFLTERQKENMMEEMCHLSRNMYNLLENLLEWSQMQNGLTVFNPELLDLKELTEKCIDNLKEAATKKGVALRIDIPEDQKIFADSNVIQTVLRNLVSNAIKFTLKDGKVIISSVAEDTDKVKVSVKDDGVGMSKEIMNSLFRLDIKSSTPDTSGKKGAGFGLLLCKELTEKNGGDISVKSVKGKGSTFSFTFPKVL